MPNLWPVFMRELRSYFNTPVAYMAGAAFLLVSGLLFSLILLDYSRYSFELVRSGYGSPVEGLTIAEGILRPTLSTTAFLLMLISPLLTMRAFAEEKKNGTIEMLLTYPIRDAELALAKMLAPLAVQGLLLGCVLLYSAMLAFFKPAPVGEIFCGFLGLALLAAFFTAIGVFVSSLTENQVIAAVGTFGLNMFFWLAGWMGGDGGPAAEVMRHLSVFEHFNRFAAGILDSSSALYFLSGAFLFFFLTLRVLESARWRS